jgi:hypothetical protein
LICALKTQELSRTQTVSKHDTILESQTCRQTEAVLLKSQGAEFERYTDIANTLMARDYKGFGNQAMNGVLECKKLDV